MKKLYTTIILSLCFIIIYGQTLSVKDFHILERDLTANIPGTMRTSPQDGNVSALIKVVTTETDFNFDGGVYALVGNPVYKKGEIWIYVPARAQKITISHNRFGVLRDYYYPIAIEAGRTYEMLLDLGVGKYATIQTSTPRSIVYLDGDSIGVSPIYNLYVLYGKHKLSSSNDKMEGSLDIEIIKDGKDGKDGAENYIIPMYDQSPHFGNVIISTDKDSEILLKGSIKGIGSWSGELREGDYVVEARKVNCDSEKTSFKVVAQTTNNISAKSPTPHMGYIQLFSRPNEIELSHKGKSLAKTELIKLPVGIQTLIFSHKGYHNLEREYYIKQNVTIKNTINLQRIQYLKPNGFYFGGSYLIGQLSGVSGIVGFTWHNIDIQGSYAFGITKSNPVNFYNSNDGTFISKDEYSLNSFSAKIGYQFALATKFGIVPQIGFSAHSLKCNVLDGESGKGDGAICSCFTIGSKFIWSPVQHFCIFAAPEYDIAMAKDKIFDVVASSADFSAGGFFCHIGLLVNF